MLLLGGRIHDIWARPGEVNITKDPVLARGPCYCGFLEPGQGNVMMP